MKAKLNDWNKSYFGNVHNKVKDVEAKLKTIHDEIDVHGYSYALHDQEKASQTLM